VVAGSRRAAGQTGNSLQHKDSQVAARERTARPRAQRETVVCDRRAAVGRQRVCVELDVGRHFLHKRTCVSAKTRRLAALPSVQPLVDSDVLHSTYNHLMQAHVQM